MCVNKQASVRIGGCSSDSGRYQKILENPNSLTDLLASVCNAVSTVLRLATVAILPGLGAR